MASDYPIEGAGVHSSDIKEITIPWYPGAILGFNVSDRVINLTTLSETGIGSGDMKEGIFIGDREWEK